MKDTQWLCVAEYCHTTLPRIPASQLLGGLLKGPPTRPSQTHSAGPSHPKQLCLWSHVPPISISASGGHQQLRAAPSQHTQGGVSLQSWMVCVGGGRCHHYFCFLYTALEIYCILR